MSKGLTLVGILCLGGCSCQDRKGTKAPPKAPAPTKGVTAVEVVAKTNIPAEPMGMAAPLQVVLRAWHRDAGEALRQLTEMLNQTRAGYTYAVTGDGRVLLKPLPAKASKAPKVKRGSDLKGMKMLVASAELAEVGGIAALVTSSQAWTRSQQIRARSVLETGLRQLAQQTGGSGRIYPIRLGEPRIDQGQIQAEVTARVLKDGASGLP